MVWYGSDCGTNKPVKWLNLRTNRCAKFDFLGDPCLGLENLGFDIFFLGEKLGMFG